MESGIVFCIENLMDSVYELVDNGGPTVAQLIGAWCTAATECGSSP
jgi:hypothetical protein